MRKYNSHLYIILYFGTSWTLCKQQLFSMLRKLYNVPEWLHIMYPNGSTVHSECFPNASSKTNTLFNPFPFSVKVNKILDASGVYWFFSAGNFFNEVSEFILSEAPEKLQKFQKSVYAREKSQNFQKLRIWVKVWKVHKVPKIFPMNCRI